MEDYLTQQYFMNSISQWLVAFAYVILGVVVSKVFYSIFIKLFKKVVRSTDSVLDDILVDTLERPVTYSIVILGFFLGLKQLNTTKDIAILLPNFGKFCITVCVTWFIVRLVNAIIEQYMKPAIELSQSTSRKQVLPIITKIITITIWTIGVIIAFDCIGYNLAGLIAGLGIGGLAFALAAKDYLENIFGGVSIFTDKPFTMNDRIKIDGFDGTVEKIGIRSSRIRTLSGSLVTIPNSKFISSSVENIALEPTRKITLRLGLTYDTNATELQKAMSLLKDIVANNQDIVAEQSIVFFENFGDFSLVIVFIYYIRKDADIPSTQSKINLDILAAYEKENLNFAFPTQTINIEGNK